MPVTAPVMLRCTHCGAVAYEGAQLKRHDLHLCSEKRPHMRGIWRPKQVKPVLTYNREREAQIIQ